MRRRSRSGGETAKPRRRKTRARRSDVNPKARPRSTSIASLEAKVARLHGELNEARDQQRATADILGAISRSKFQLQSILQSVVDTASQLCRADASVIFRLEGEVYRFAAGYSLIPSYMEHERQNPISAGRGTLIGRVAINRQVVQIEDAWTDPLYEQKAVAGVGRSMIGVPLMRNGEPIGVIGLSRNRVAPFAQREIALVTTFADQAVIAIENARLLTDLSESLERQTATSDVLRIISSSPGDLEVVFRKMLEDATRICDAKFGTVDLKEGGGLRLAAAYGVPPRFAALRGEGPFHPAPGGILDTAAKTARTVHIPDLAATQSYIKRHPRMVDAVEVAGIRTAVGVPMLRENELVGIIAIFRQEVNPFTDKQIELVTNFATQAVIAIENARLLTELRQSLEQQTATAEVLGVISSSKFELQPILQSVVDTAARLCRADAAVIFRLQDSIYRFAAGYSLDPAYLEIERRTLIAPGAGTLVGRAAMSRQVVRIDDAWRDPAYEKKEQAKLGQGSRSMMGIPLMRDSEAIGVIGLARSRVEPFTEREVDLVTTFADQAVIAIENVRLFEAEQQRSMEVIEALEQQTATSEVLQVISKSPGDLEPVFAAMLEKAVRLCGAHFGNLLLCDGDAFRVVAMHNAPPAYAQARLRELVHPGPHTTLGEIMRTKRPAQVVDMQAGPGYRSRDPVVVAAVELAGIRTMLAVPMLKDEEVVGSINIYRQEVLPFTDKQIEIVHNFASQAVIAIENARLLRELRARTTDLSESLEQQTATSEILEVISNSPTDSQPAFDAIVRSGIRLFPNAAVVISLPDGDQVKLAAIAGTNGEDRERLRARYPLPLSREYITSTAIIERREFDFADARETPVELIRGGRNFLASGYRAITVVPMLRGLSAIGAISIARRQPGSLTEKQRDLLRTFASQAVIAIENTRLFHELRARTDDLSRSVGELRALGEVSQAVNSTLDLETVLETIVANAVRLSGTEAGAIYVFNDQRREFCLRATYGMDRELIDALANADISINEPNIALLLAERKVIQVADLQDEATNKINEITLRAGFRARLIAPLIHGEEVVGLLVVRRRAPGAFPQNTIDLIETFAAQSAVAIENARLFKNVESSLEDLRTTQDRLVQTQKLASLGQLTAGIAHEIKNPLNFVNNFSSISTELIGELQEVIATVKVNDKTRAEIAELTDTLRDNLGKIVQHGKRADSIVKNMLLHSREGSSEHRPVGINSLVEEAVNLAYHGARAEKQAFNITLERSLAPDAGEVDCFPQEITRVLLNLISNGFYAANKRKEQAAGDGFGPVLTTTTRNLGDRVEIRIRDNGIGIPPEVRDKMFNPFFTTKPAGEGTGLGLSISHDIIVKQHSGSIEVDTRPGEFTEFRIVLPRSTSPANKPGERA